IAAASVTASDLYAYQELLDSRTRVTSAEEAERFYDRFWSGQMLQYEHWRRKLIPDAIYGDWLLKRRRQFEENAAIAGVPFQAAWAARYEGHYRHTAFGAFMQRVLTAEAGGAADAFAGVMKAIRRRR